MQAMRSRNDESMVETFKSGYDFLQKYDCSPKLHVLDNERSKAIQNFVLNKDTCIQLVEPLNRRVNAAETAIKAAKYHIIAGLQTVDLHRLSLAIVEQVHKANAGHVKPAQNSKRGPKKVGIRGTTRTL